METCTEIQSLRDNETSNLNYDTLSWEERYLLGSYRIFWGYNQKGITDPYCCYLNQCK